MLEEARDLRTRARVVVGSATIAVLILGLAAASWAQLAPGGTFVDDDGNFHEPNIEAIAAAGLTAGCDAAERRYCPTTPVSRAEMAVFIVRALDETANVPTYQGYFLDVPVGSWYTPSVERLYELGISTGRADGIFDPAGLVSRAEMAAFLVRAFAPSADISTFRGYFTDVVATDWFAGYAEHLYELGVTTGCGTGTYCPSSAVLRDQMASFLARALGLEPIYPPSTTTSTTTLPPTTTSTTIPGGSGLSFWSCSTGFSSFSCSGDTDQLDFFTEFWSCSEGFSGFSCSGNIDKTDSFTEFWSCSEGFSGFSCSGNVDKRDSFTEFWSCSVGFAAISCSGNIDKTDFLTEYWSCSVGFAGFSCSGDVDKLSFGTEYWSCSEGFYSASCSGNPGFLAPIVSPVPYFTTNG